jgi:hypothetical protein
VEEGRRRESEKEIAPNLKKIIKGCDLQKITEVHDK